MQTPWRTHGVTRLPHTPTAGRLGKAERYSLSFSCGLTPAFEELDDAHIQAELLSVLNTKPRFESVTTVPALRPAPELTAYHVNSAVPAAPAQ